MQSNYNASSVNKSIIYLITTSHFSYFTNLQFSEMGKDSFCKPFNPPWNEQFAPENRPSQKESSIPTYPNHPFSGANA